MTSFGFSAASLLGLQAAVVFLICYAMVSDFTRLRIPNWIPAALVALFLAYAALRLDLAALGSHLLLAGIVFAVGLASFILRLVGGGDVKLITALALWAGPSHGADLLIWTTLGGGLMAAGLLMLRASTQARMLMPTAAPFARIRTLAERGVCPYGLAIGTGALVALQPMFQSV
ncbi:MAG: prepilin peptidase [Hyphomicrobiaceae bacterium]|nr:prepilin peptidase [Hyphomicrobiaceae bacterium]